MSKMSDALNSWDDQTARGQFVQTAFGYIDLLCRHIQKEDQDISQMVEGICSIKDDRDLTNSFVRYEVEELGEGLLSTSTT